MTEVVWRAASLLRDGLALSEFKLDERPLVSRRGNPWEVRDQKSGENR